MTKNDILTEKTVIASNMFKRMKGLMFKKDIDYAMVIKPCKSVHTFFMKMPIDVIFVSSQNVVLDVIRDMKPNRISPTYWKASYVIEVKSGNANKTQPGDILRFV